MTYPLSSRRQGIAPGNYMAGPSDRLVDRKARQNNANIAFRLIAHTTMVRVGVAAGVSRRDEKGHHATCLRSSSFLVSNETVPRILSASYRPAAALLPVVIRSPPLPRAP